MGRVMPNEAVVLMSAVGDTLRDSVQAKNKKAECLG